MNLRGFVSVCACLGLFACGGEDGGGGSSSFGGPYTTGPDDGGDGNDGNDGGSDGSDGSAGSGGSDDGGSGGGSGGSSTDDGATTGGSSSSATTSGGVGTTTTADTTTPTQGGTTTPTTTGGGTSSVTTTGGGTTSGTTTDDCSCVMGLDDGIFVLSDAAEIYKYVPDTDTFNFIGGFSCPGVGLGDSTFSMAVDRKGFAWVMFNASQKIYHVDLQTFPLQCTDPGYVVGQMPMGHGPYNHFGMAFVSNSIDDRCDKLYGNTFDGSGFSEGPIGTGEFLVLEPSTLQVSYIGDTTFDGAELTGTGDGRAYMFGGTNPAKLVEVDKTNGTYVDVTNLTGLDLTNAFAFAFFEGDFYFFTESGAAGSNSKVTHLDFDDTGQLTDTPNVAPIRVVGAGVSTCVSIVPQ